MQIEEKQPISQSGREAKAGASPPSLMYSLPLMVGVTGHRDLRREDYFLLEEKVQGLFNDLRKNYPHTPLMLLSPLAEGADRLVARVALSCGVGLVAPLPMSRQEYERDFETEESRAEFGSLLERASQVIEMPLAKGVRAAELKSDPEARARQYLQVGAFIVLHSQILIALWDGKPSDKTGGTAQIVHFQLEGIPEPCLRLMSEPTLSSLNMLDPQENGPVYHVVTPRSSDPTPSGEPLSVRILNPSGHGDEEGLAVYQQMHRNIDSFNKDAIEIRERHPEAVERCAGYLLPEDEAKLLPDRLLTIRSHYALADALAQQYQRRTFRIFTGLVALVFTGVACLEWHAHMSHMVALLWLYPAILGVAFIIYYFAKRINLQGKYQDYRAFAEGLRVQFFWGLARIPTSVAEHYLRKQRSELDWIRIAIRNLFCVAGPPEPHKPARNAHDSKKEEADRLGFVLQYWIQDQRTYFAKAIKREEAALTRHERWSRFCFLLGPAITIVLAILMTAVPSLQPALSEGGARLTGLGLPFEGSWLGSWLSEAGSWRQIHSAAVIVIVLSAVYAALVHWHSDKKALAQHIKQYKRMESLFVIAQRNVVRCLTDRDYEKASHLILDIGKEALAENGDWVLTHRDRPLEVPEAG